MQYNADYQQYILSVIGNERMDYYWDFCYRTFEDVICF